MTTYTDFVGNVAGLSITGVVRAYTEPPSRIASADMPLSFPRLPSGDESIVSLGGYGELQWPVLRAELVVVIHPMQLETDDVKFSDTLTVMDNMTTALRGATLASAPVSWTIRSDTIFLSDTLYHAVIADIQTKG